MLFMWKSVACTLSYHAAKTLCGALFAELWVTHSFAKHPCPGLPTFSSLNALESIPWRDNILPNNLENTGMQWVYEYDRSAVWSQCSFCSISGHELLTQGAQTLQRIPYSCWFLFLVYFIGLLHFSLFILPRSVTNFCNIILFPWTDS